MSGDKTNSIWGIVIKAAIAPVVTAILAVIFPAIREFWLWIWSFVVSGWEWLFAYHSWPGWLVAVMAVCTAAVFIVLALALREHFTKRSAQSDPWWKSFKEMDFNGANWRWSWSSTNEIKNLAPYCPQCDGLLVYEEPSRDILYGYQGNQVKLFCENCNHRLVSAVISHTYFSATRVIQREIHRRVRVEDKARNQASSH